MGAYESLDAAGRRREHYAVERLCERAADKALQFLKVRGETLPASYREIFSTLEQAGVLPPTLAADLIAACGIRNLLTHLYEQIDLDRVVAVVDPAMVLYGAFAQWALDQLGGGRPETGEAPAHESPAGPE